MLKPKAAADLEDKMENLKLDSNEEAALNYIDMLPK
jgi:hypothetical protein